MELGMLLGSACVRYRYRPTGSNAWQTACNIAFFFVYEFASDLCSSLCGREGTCSNFRAKDYQRDRDECLSAWFHVSWNPGKPLVSVRRYDYPNTRHGATCHLGMNHGRHRYQRVDDLVPFYNVAVHIVMKFRQIRKRKRNDVEIQSSLSRWEIFCVCDR